MSKYVKISKLEAARIQLETAITLFLKNDNEVAIYTLAGASYAILRELARSKGVKDAFIDVIKKERIKDFVELINEPYNFFRHANKDPETQLKFYYEGTEFLILHTCRLYRDLIGEESKLMSQFELWFITKYPDVLKIEDDYGKRLYDFASNMDYKNKRQFLR